MITNTSLENFKCFRNSPSISFTQFNVLTGINGRGKSSLLQSLLLLGQSFDSNNSLGYLKLNGKFISLGTFKDVKNSTSDSNTFSISFKTDDSDENDIQCSFHTYQEKETLAQFTNLLVNGNEYVDLPTQDSDVANENDASEKTIGVTSSIAGLQQLRKIKFVTADRKGPTNYAEKNDGILPADIGIRGENVINTLFSIRNDSIVEVEKVLSDILHGASLRVPPTNTSNIIELFIDSIDKTNGYMPVNVGFGYSYILPVVLAPLLAEDGSIIIIENPEAHLHPAAQSRLTQFLVDIAKKKNLQMFLETHSDHVVNGLRIAVKDKKIEQTDAGIIHFSRSNEIASIPEIYQIRIDKNGNLSDYPNDFMEEWANQMSQLV